MATSTKRYRRTRVTQRQEEPEDELLRRLAPLKTGTAVVLQVEMRRKHGNVLRERKALMLIAPGPMYGMLESAVLISIVGMGSTVLIPATREGVSDLAKAGLPTNLIVALVERLKKLYGE